MTERPDSEGGVFIPTDKIYDLLREHMSLTNERLVEIRSDIRAMNEQNHEIRDGHRDHEGRLRKVEEKLNKLPATVITSAVSAVISSVLLYLKFTGK